MGGTMTQQEKDLYERHIKYHGIEQETTIAMEECSELIKAISKCKRYGCVDKYRDNWIEEIADVEIMLEQMKVLLNLSDEAVEGVKNIKVNRELARIKEGSK